MSKENPHWPDAVRVKMIEKSEFYQEPKVYQYGYYDGYQELLSELTALKLERDRLVDIINEARKGLLSLKNSQIGDRSYFTAKAYEILSKMVYTNDISNTPTPREAIELYFRCRDNAEGPEHFDQLLQDHNWVSIAKQSLNPQP